MAPIKILIYSIKHFNKFISENSTGNKTKNLNDSYEMSVFFKFYPLYKVQKTGGSEIHTQF